jgi:hypothetical protein
MSPDFLPPLNRSSSDPIPKHSPSKSEAFPRPLSESAHMNELDQKKIEARKKEREIMELNGEHQIDFFSDTVDEQFVPKIDASIYSKKRGDLSPFAALRDLEFAPDSRLEQKKENPTPDTSLIIKCFKLLFAIIASFTFANNSFFGALKFYKLLFGTFTSPTNLAELTKNGLQKTPLGATVFACLAAIASELVNVYQTYDFGERAMTNIRKLTPILEKLWQGKALTRKEKGILSGIVVSIGAAAGAAKLSWDATSKSSEWYFRILMGILGVISFFSMTLITRSVTVQKFIENTDWFYANPDKAYLLRLLQALTPFYSSKTQTEIMDSNEFRQGVIDLTDCLKQYNTPIPSNLDYVLAAYFASFNQSKIPSRMNFVFAALFALVGWLIYTDKLASVFPKDLFESVGKVLQGLWETFRGITSIFGSSPHMFFFFYSAEVILNNIKNSLTMNLNKTLLTGALMAIVLLTCLGLFNVSLDIEKNSHLIPMPEEESPRGWNFAILSLFDAFWPNLNTMLNMITLKKWLDTLGELLKVNPFHTTSLKIINEELTVEEKQLQENKRCQLEHPSLVIDIPPPIPEFSDPKHIQSLSPTAEPKSLIDETDETLGEHKTTRPLTPVSTEKLRPLAEAIQSFKQIESIIKQSIFKPPTSHAHQGSTLKQPLLAGELSDQEEDRSCFSRIRSWCGGRASR